MKGSDRIYSVACAMLICACVHLFQGSSTSAAFHMKVLWRDRLFPPTCSLSAGSKYNFTIDGSGPWAGSITFNEAGSGRVYSVACDMLIGACARPFQGASTSEAFYMKAAPNTISLSSFKFIGAGHGPGQL